MNCKDIVGGPRRWSSARRKLISTQTLLPGIETLVEFIVGLALLLTGAEALVRGAVRLARRLGWSPLVAGLVIVAFGTSAPELAVGIAGAVDGHVSAALGNAIGSNLFNLLFILGLSALIVPIDVQSSIVRHHIPVLLLTGIGLWALSLNGYLGRLEGLLLCAAAAAYIVVSIRQSVSTDLLREDPSNQPARSALIDPGLVVVGISFLALGAYWLTDAAPAVGALLGLDEFVVGLLMMSLGTSLPELASVIASLRQRQADLATGNIIGSCIFNLLAVIGAISAISPDSVVVPQVVIIRELPLMLVAALLLLPLAISGKRLSRWEGLILFAAYIIFVLIVLIGPGSGDKDVNTVLDPIVNS